MSSPLTAQQTLANTIINRAEELLVEAEESTRPLEIDPFRSRLFELFVTAHGAGHVTEDADPDLTADGLARALSERWDLADATRASIEQQSRLPAEQLSKMRLLWSLMRMWMEWSYAWERWPEFHGGDEH